MSMYYLFYISMCIGKNMSLVKKVLLYNRYRFLLRWTNRQRNKLTFTSFDKLQVELSLTFHRYHFNLPTTLNENLARQLKSLCAKE